MSFPSEPFTLSAVTILSTRAAVKYAARGVSTVLMLWTHLRLSRYYISRKVAHPLMDLVVLSSLFQVRAAFLRSSTLALHQSMPPKLSRSFVSIASYPMMLMLVVGNSKLLKTTRKKHLIVDILFYNTSFFMLSFGGTPSSRFSSAVPTARGTIGASLPPHGSPRMHFTA